MDYRKNKKLRQLIDIRVGSVALVDKGANRRPFFLFKRAESPEGDNIMARPIEMARKAVEKAASLQEIITACLDILKGNPDEAELGEVVKMLEGAIKNYPKPEQAADGSYPYPYPYSKSENGKHVIDLEKVVAEIEKRGGTLKAHNKAALDGAVKVVKGALDNKDEETLTGDAAIAKVQEAFKKSADNANIAALLGVEGK